MSITFDEKRYIVREVYDMKKSGFCIFYFHFIVPLILIVPYTVSGTTKRNKLGKATMENTRENICQKGNFYKIASK